MLNVIDLYCETSCEKRLIATYNFNLPYSKIFNSKNLVV